MNKVTFSDVVKTVALFSITVILVGGSVLVVVGLFKASPYHAPDKLTAPDKRSWILPLPDKWQATYGDTMETSLVYTCYALKGTAASQAQQIKAIEKALIALNEATGSKLKMRMSQEKPNVKEESKDESSTTVGGYSVTRIDDGADPGAESDPNKAKIPSGN